MKGPQQPVTIAPSFLMMADMSENKAEKTAWLQLVAGTDNQGMPVLEKLEVKIRDQQSAYELLRSPLFIRDLAAGDVFTCAHDNPADYKVLERSGNLAIRIFRKDNIDELEDSLTPEVEKLGGSLDLTTDRALVYSLHVNIGFGEIEKLFECIYIWKFDTKYFSPFFHAESSLFYLIFSANNKK